MAHSISIKRRKQIARSVKRAAKKQGAKYGMTGKKLKIQTAPTWKRLAIGLSSLLFLALAFLLHSESLIGTVACSLVFLFILGVAIVGDKKTIDGGLNGLDAGISDKVLDGIIDRIF